MHKTTLTLSIVSIALIGGIALFLLARPAAAPQTESAALSTSTAPWPAETARLKARLVADSLPALAQEGTVLHIHQHIDLFIDGTPVAIPAGIGIDEAAGFIAPIHVHDTTGIIHVESPYVATFTLGQFFDIWGVRFTNECLGGYCASASDSLRVYVNGQRYQGDLRAIPLTAHEEIAIIFGTATETPTTIPSSYAFPAGY